MRAHSAWGGIFASHQKQELFLIIRARTFPNKRHRWLKTRSRAARRYAARQNIHGMARRRLTRRRPKGEAADAAERKHGKISTNVAKDPRRPAAVSVHSEADGGSMAHVSRPFHFTLHNLTSAQPTNRTVCPPPRHLFPISIGGPRKIAQNAKFT